MAQPRPSRVRHPRIRRLVQPPKTPRTNRTHPTHREGGQLPSSTKASPASWTQVKHSPANPVRFRCRFPTADYGGPLLTFGGFRLPLADPLLPTHSRRATKVPQPKQAPHDPECSHGYVMEGAIYLVLPVFHSFTRTAGPATAATAYRRLGLSRRPPHPSYQCNITWNTTYTTAAIEHHNNAETKTRDRYLPHHPSTSTSDTTSPTSYQHSPGAAPTARNPVTPHHFVQILRLPREALRVRLLHIGLGSLRSTMGTEGGWSWIGGRFAGPA